MTKIVVLLFALVFVVACGTPITSTAPTNSPEPIQTLSPAPIQASPSAPSPTASAPTRTASAPGATANRSGEVTLLTHDAFAVSDSVITSFETQSGDKLNVLKGGDAGAMVNQAILTKNAPLADVLYGVDNTFLSRALDAGIFVPYVSPAAASVSADFKLDPQNRVTPIDYGDVCVVYDATAAGGLATPPKTINDLTKPVYKGALVVENPATSSPGLAFLLATIVRFGESGDYTWLDYWRNLRANDVVVSDSWDDAYYNEFSGGGSGGNRPLVISYATDPAAAVTSAGATSGPPGVQKVDDGCFRQVEFAGVLAGAKNAAGAEAWIDFMASPELQSDMPLNMFVFPVNPVAQLPDVFKQYAVQATDPLTMDPASIAANRDKWIQQWTDVVVH